MTENTDLKPDADWSAPQPEHLPRPTYWPACMAIGWVTLAYGLLFSLYFAALGAALVVAGAYGWIEELRHEHE